MYSVVKFWENSSFDEKRHHELFPVTDSKAGLLKAGFGFIQSLLFGLTRNIFNPYFVGDQIKGKEVTREYSAMAEIRNAYKILVRNSKVQRMTPDHFIT